jgi:hypothetical protein
VDKIKFQAGGPGDGIQDLEALGHYFRPGAVAGDNGNTMGHEVLASSFFFKWAIRPPSSRSSCMNGGMGVLW